MKRSILAIGDLMSNNNKPEYSLTRFLWNTNRLLRRGIDFKFITYDDLLLNRLPDIFTKRLKIVLFFPYSYWNSQIERYDKDDRIYGDSHFGDDHQELFFRVDRIIKNRYKDHDVSFVNSPLSSILDRDKRKTCRLLKRAGLHTPHVYNIFSMAQVNRLIDKGKTLYIKPVFGSMGKGITYIDKKHGCFSNFLFRRGEVISRASDYNWAVRKVHASKVEDFIKVLIKRRFLFQEGIETPRCQKRRFDLRIYTVNGKIPYMYAKSAPSANFLTNWSQGGRIEKKRFLKKALRPKTIRRAKALAVDAAKVLALNYAGADIIIDKDQENVYLLEIQSFPGYERGFNLMRFLIDEL
ncbi:MAG: hypothetical protein HQ558_03260 [Candidatus Omnitrophica bacterium]|nr:hypothetical protein [Candidatus Omnitrophota bacterium]